MSEWQGKQVFVIGLGIEGEDLARYFAGQGADVTVSDTKDAEALEQRIQQLAGLGVRFRLGGNDPADVLDADLVCVSQGVPQSNPAVAAARNFSKRLETGTTLFLSQFPGPIVGITGSSGKTTTTSLVDAIFTAAGREHVLGGNIGQGLMSLLEGASVTTWAVVEISHTQLVLTERSPQVAALLGITPNHLDQFSWEEYIQLKRKIFAFQKAGDTVVFNAADPISRELRSNLETAAQVYLFSIEADHGASGAFLRDGAVWWRRGDRNEAAVSISDIPLRGSHNLANVAAATAIAAACNIEPRAVGRAVRAFKAPPHRLEFVAKVNGADFFNDSIATTPERALAALRAFDQPSVLLLGGRDKQLPLDSLMSEVSRRCRAVVAFGESGLAMAHAAQQTGVTVVRTATLSQAVEAASAQAQAGDVVLLSPACTSFDAYENFEQRGADFRELVASLAKGEPR